MVEVKDARSGAEWFWDWFSGPPFLGFAVIVSIGLVMLLNANCRVDSEPPSVASIPVDIQDMAITAIKQYALVRQASVHQDGPRVNLVLLVDYGIDHDYARQLGDNFVRMVKALGPDESPGKTVGEGRYEYVVGVYTPDEERVVLGVKVRSDEDITW